VLDEFDLDVDDAGPEQRKLCKAVGEFGGYLRANAASIPNYGERYRAGEVISSSLAESTINQVVSKRDGEEAANALDATRRAPTPSSPHPCVCSTTTSPTTSAAGTPASPTPSKARQPGSPLPRNLPRRGSGWTGQQG